MTIAIIKPTLKHFAFHRSSMPAWHRRYLIFIRGEPLPDIFTLREAKIECRKMKVKFEIDMTDWR